MVEELLHKIYVDKSDEISILKLVLYDKNKKTKFDIYDNQIKELMAKNSNNTLFKLENRDGVIAGFCYFDSSHNLKDYEFRNIFKINSYFYAIKQIAERELIIKSNSSISILKNNKII